MSKAPPRLGHVIAITKWSLRQPERLMTVTGQEANAAVEAAINEPMTWQGIIPGR